MYLIGRDLGRVVTERYGDLFKVKKLAMWCDTGASILLVLGVGSLFILALADTSSVETRRLYVACLIAPVAASLRGFLHQRIKQGEFPMLTLGINFTGCVAMAICFVVQSNFDCGEWEVICWSHVIIPFLASWTTFSSVVQEIVVLREGGKSKMMWGYVILLVASSQILSGVIIAVSYNFSRGK